MAFKACLCANRFTETHLALHVKTRSCYAYSILQLATG